MRLTAGVLVLVSASLAAQVPRNAEHVPHELPLGLVRADYQPPTYPIAQGWIDLGKTLFFDPVLSVDESVSCASCHNPAHGFASPEKLPRGVQGRRALRHSPTLFNRAFSTRQRWDGRTDTLDEQVLRPIEDPNEMNLELVRALRRVSEQKSYRTRFAELGAPVIGRDELARALASYVRSLVLGDSVIDRFRAAETKHVTTLEKTGLWIYESKGRCWRCHSGGNFTDEKFHNTGVGLVRGEPVLGRMAVTGDERDRGAFKTPTLRGLAMTAPYMHDGSLATLEDVVEFYRRGGNANRALDRRMRPLELSDHEAKALVAFLKALSRKPEGAARAADPKARVR